LDKIKSVQKGFPAFALLISRCAIHATVLRIFNIDRPADGFVCRFLAVDRPDCANPFCFVYESN